MSAREVRIGYVPEHYLLPLHFCNKHNLFPSSIRVRLIPFPSGTGHMITSLRSNEIDLAIGLTEGWVAGLLNPGTYTQSAEEKGYSIVGSWVSTPLRWAIVTGRNRPDINSVDDLKNHRRVGVSRIGSGSHVMAFVLAQQEGWLDQAGVSKSEGLAIVPLGPFKDLRDGVTNSSADFFMWEQFTTKPYFDGEDTPLKKIGEIYTPWPSWHIAASLSTFPNPASDDTLKQIFESLDLGIKAFNADPDAGIRMLGTGEAGCHYSEEDGREWLKDVRFVQGTRGVDPAVMSGVVDVLKTAGVIGGEVVVKDGDGVVGIAR
ncbi:alpha 1,3-glucosidase [Capronia epimyces CBS 606.96]|uniref:Alpha 1,3-glucosidase n=1 Tax=Capronia epimyces CBS 606.96 TaxID=1182542 RepID=W9ZAN2_9EURO|nr:alpha 1,3-glucosidase [Capronia epimyces CBS 606.96]EXJ91579.1 alpha 1,3-glucosidase [Capronia epimyces CBS 606.96]